MTPLDLTDNDLVTDTLAALHPHEHGGQAGLKIVCLKLALSGHWYQSEPQEEWSGVTEDG